VEAVDAVREELVQAVLAGAGHPLQFPVQSVQLTFQVGITRAGGGSGKVSLKVLELGRERRREEQSVHTVTVNLGAPVDDAGLPFKVVAQSTEKP